MSEAPDPREQEDCPSNTICRGTCDQHSPLRPEHVHVPYLVRTAGVTICEECGAGILSAEGRADGA